MPRLKHAILFGSVMLLAACEMQVGKDGDAAAGNGTAEATAEGKAEEGQFSINAPGFDLKVDIPQGMTENADVDSDSDILYPGSRLSGMHVEAEQGAGGGKGAVELRFVSNEPPAKLFAWYREPARSSAFTVRSVEQQGRNYVVEAVSAGDGDPFTISLAPRTGGGTDGTALLRDRS